MCFLFIPLLLLVYWSAYFIFSPSFVGVSGNGFYYKVFLYEIARNVI